MERVLRGRGAAGAEQPNSSKVLSQYRRPASKKKTRAEKAKRAALARWSQPEEEAATATAAAAAAASAAVPPAPVQDNCACLWAFGAAEFISHSAFSYRNARYGWLEGLFLNRTHAEPALAKPGFAGGARRARV